MQIKRKLVGTLAEMIDYLVDAHEATLVVDEQMKDQRDDTRIRRAERRGYMDGLLFAIHALEDWEPTTQETKNDEEG